MPNEFKIKNGLVVEQGPSQITGSLLISGSLVTTQGITGSLFGTASFAQSASYADVSASLGYLPLNGDFTLLPTASLPLNSSDTLVVNQEGVVKEVAVNKVGEIIIAKFFPALFGINTTDQWYTSGHPFLNGAWNTSQFYGSGSLPSFAIDYKDKPSLINSFNKPLKSIIWAIDYGDWYQLDLCIIKTDSFSNQQSNHRAVLMPYNIRVLTTTPSLNHPKTGPFSKYQIEIPINDTMDTPANAFNSAYHLFIKGQSSAGSNRATIYFKF
jgi:hypothetical protein